MPWPNSQDYNEAIQSPETSFADPELRQGEAVCNALGIPMPCSGNFADVYQFKCPATERTWAIKCFTRQVPGLRERYRHISQHLEMARLPFMVEFTFLEQGVKIHGDWFPLLKMKWVAGFTLNQFVKEHLENPPVLESLCQIWVKLAKRLREANLAHCDLQHGNVLLVPGSTATSLGIRLVDYDGMWVPALAGRQSNELGHPNYQHPQRLRDKIYSSEVDRFPHLAIYTALRGLLAGGRPLWDRFDTGDNLLFTQKDFEAPDRSAVFQTLQASNNPEVRELVQALRTAAKGPLTQTPHVDELASRTMITAAPPLQASATPSSSEPFAALTEPPLSTGIRSSPAIKASEEIGPPTLLHVPGAPGPKAGPGFALALSTRHKLLLGGGLVAALGAIFVVGGILLLAAMLMGSKGASSSGAAKGSNSETSSKISPPTSTIESTPKLYLASLPALDKKCHQGLGRGTLAANLPEPIKVNGIAYRQGLGTHPVETTGIASVKFDLKGLAPRSLHGFVAVNDTAKDGSASPLTFQVRSDGNILWTSPPVQARGQTREFTIDIPAVEVLELRVTCQDKVAAAHAVWIDPYIETGLSKSKRDEYLQSLPIYLSDMQGLDAVAWGNMGIGQVSANWDRTPLTFKNKPLPNSLGLHPPKEKGTSRVRYQLGKKFSRLTADVAINDTAKNKTGSPLVFRVICDGKSAWKSHPVQVTGESQPCDVDLTNVEILELAVDAEGSVVCAHAVWVEPRLTRAPERRP
jgi:hypothetical protein